MGDTRKQAIHLLFFETVSLHSGWPSTHNFLVFVSQGLGFQTYTFSTWLPITTLTPPLQTRLNVNLGGTPKT